MAKKARPVKGTKEKKHVIEKEKVKARDGKQPPLQPAADSPRTSRTTRKGSAGRSAAASGMETSGDEASKSSRLTLIKTMHEARKREFEQIREELESDEEE